MYYKLFCIFSTYYDNAASRIIHRFLFVIFWPKKKHCNHVSVNVLAGLGPWDFLLILKLRRRRFATIEEIKTTSLEELNAISKNIGQKCSEDWIKRWNSCVLYLRLWGDYFERDQNRYLWINCTHVLILDTWMIVNYN